MKLTEYQRHEVLRELIPSLPYAHIAGRLLAPPSAQKAPARRRNLLSQAWHTPLDLVGRWRHHLVRQRTIAELKKLGPALLLDIGIEYADIERVVDTLIAARAAAAANPGKERVPVAATLVDRR